MPIQQACQQQKDLGWDNFIRGRHSTLWKDAFDMLINQLQTRRGKPRTGKSIAMKFVKSSLQLLVGIWREHN